MNTSVVIVEDKYISKPHTFNCLQDAYSDDISLTQEMKEILVDALTYNECVKVVTYSTYQQELSNFKGTFDCFCNIDHLMDVVDWCIENDCCVRIW